MAHERKVTDRECTDCGQLMVTGPEGKIGCRCGLVLTPFCPDEPASNWGLGEGVIKTWVRNRKLKP